MRAVKVYIDFDDLTKIIRGSVPVELLDGTEDCTWAPVKIELTPGLDIQITAVATENN